MIHNQSKKYSWAGLGDEALLNLRFCDLKLTIKGTPLEERIMQLYGELYRRHLKFRPHCWLSTEWFSPDGVPGIAIPFYLAHPRLAKLEFKHMYDVEGGTARWCMQLLRHEAGHAIDTAYRLHRRKRWRKIFGSYTKPYPSYYTPNPKSKNFVYHLDWWYAQSHPAEDYAETFAVWLQPGSNWRKVYEGWPVLKKLEYMNELMNSINDQTPPVRLRETVEPLSENKKTLREYYEEKRAFYGINIPEVYDSELVRLFPGKPENSSKRLSAAAFLRKIKPEITQLCARSVGESPYVIAQILQDMIVRCRALKLYVTRAEEEVQIEVAVFVCLQTLDYIHKYRHSVPV
jgi:hypothetical protein